MMMNNTKKYQTLLKFNLNSNHHELIYDGFYFQRFFLLKLLNNASICWHTAPQPSVGEKLQKWSDKTFLLNVINYSVPSQTPRSKRGRNAASGGGLEEKPN